MGRVIVPAWGTAGDVLPFVAVGAELEKRGHDVVLVSNPAFEQRAVEAKLSFVPVGTLAQYRELIEDSGLWDRERVVRTLLDHYLPTTELFYRTVAGNHVPGRTVLFCTPGIHGARIAQERLGIPYVAGLITPSRLKSRLDPAHPSRPFPRPFARTVRTPAALRALHGLRTTRLALSKLLRRRDATPGWFRRQAGEIQRVRALAELGESWTPEAVFPQGVVCMWPPWFSAPQKDWPGGATTSGFPFHLKPRPRPSPDRDGNGKGEERDASRPVVFTRGSAASHQRDFFEMAVECCRRLGRPGLLVTPHTASVPPDLGETIRHVPFAEFGELFGRSLAVVHHGGVGTIAYALAAGTPQVIVPIVGEQFDLGYRAERLGVARMIADQDTTARRLARAIGSVIASERVRRRCRQLREELDVDAGCSVTADVIVRVLEANQPGVRGRA